MRYPVPVQGFGGAAYVSTGVSNGAPTATFVSQYSEFDSNSASLVRCLVLHPATPHLFLAHTQKGGAIYENSGLVNVSQQYNRFLSNRANEVRARLLLLRAERLRRAGRTARWQIVWSETRIQCREGQFT